MGFLRRHDNGRVFNTDKGKPDSTTFKRIAGQDKLRRQAAAHNLYAGKNLELRLMPGAVKVENADLFYDSEKDGYKLVYDDKVLLWVSADRSTVQKVRPADPKKEKAINEALRYLGLENEIIKGLRSEVKATQKLKELERKKAVLAGWVKRYQDSEDPHDKRQWRLYYDQYLETIGEMADLKQP